MSKSELTPESWLAILASAYSLFEDAETRGLGTPPFALGGGTADGMIGKVRDFILAENRARSPDMSGGMMAMVLNAVSNSSRTPVSERQILAILTTGDGPGHLVPALFGDCSFETLDRLGAEHDVPRATIRRAYAHARAKHAALNEEMEETFREA